MAEEPTPDMVPRAELERAVNAAVTCERRKRREAQAALLVTVGLLLAACGAFMWWMEHKAAEQRTLDARSEAEWATVTEGTEKHVQVQLELAADLRRQYRFADAGKVLDAIEPFAHKGPARLRPQLEQAKADLTFVRELDTIRLEKLIGPPQPVGREEGNGVPLAARYQGAFAARGFDIVGGSLHSLVQRIAAAQVRGEILTAVDDWLAVEPDPAIRDRLFELIRVTTR